MKKKLIIILALITLSFIFTGCELPSSVENMSYDTQPTLNPEEASKEDIEALFAKLISRPELVPNEIPDEIISTKYVNLGLLQIYYKSETDAKLKLQVIKDDNRVVYNLSGDGRVESFSLQYGSGEYKVRIMENIRDDEYLAVESKIFEADIDDDIVVYLNSIQNIDWNYEKLPIQDVPYIVYDSLDENNDELLYDCTEDLYFFATDNIKYDYQKADTLPYDYLPDIEETYIDKTGICYDYAALYASMLRSIGVPAKLVKGYMTSNPDVYHAWTEVYINGRWMILDPTMGSGEFGKFTLIDAEKNADKYIKVYEY